ncbi:hypothetical protein ACXR8U_21685 [Methylobacterium radiotolerans]|uniref:hypothetical protein n=1 Tax=Methylobacterium radiotolerans TaxID=31998 RepID=UPI0011815C4F|nr:hypothetical protein [Methylobacterium radiotolerans]
MYISEALDHVRSVLSPEEIAKVDPYFLSKGPDVAATRAATDKLIISLRRGELAARAETWGHTDKHVSLYMGNTAFDLPAELWSSDASILPNNKVTWRKRFPLEGDMIRSEDYEFAHGVHVSREDVEELWPKKLLTAPSNENERARPAKVVSSKPDRPRGPPPSKRESIKAAMRNMSRADLRSMKEEAMAVDFGASRDTCRKAREEVLSEIVDD